MFRQDFTCPALLVSLGRQHSYGAITHHARLSRRFRLNFQRHWPGPRSLATTNGVSLMSFPPGTEMFQFPGFALNPYGFRVQSPHRPRSPSPRSPLDSRYGVEGGLPHSEIPGSKLVRSSPRLIAAYHVLHRLSAPRHPPNALKTLDRSHDRCPPLGSAGHRVQKDHFHPQPARNANGARRIEDGACRTRPSTPGGRGPPQASDMFPLYDVKHPPTASAAANSKSG